MKIYGIKIEYYNEFESYKCIWDFSDTREGIYRKIANIRRSELAAARITKYTFNAEQIEETY